MSRELKHLVRVCFVGMRTLLQSYEVDASEKATDASNDNFNAVDKGTIENYFNIEEIQMLRNFFKWGIQDLKLLCSSKVSPSAENRAHNLDTVPVPGSNFMSESDLKELADYFAAAFCVIDPKLWRVVIYPNLEELVDLIASGHPLFLAIPQFWLAHSTCGVIAAEILLTFLMAHLSELSQPTLATDRHAVWISRSTYSQPAAQTNNRVSVMLRLIKTLFTSLNAINSVQNVIRPQIRSITLSCLRHILVDKISINFCYLLKSILRYIQSSKADDMIEDMVSMLPLILEGTMDSLYAICRQNKTFIVCRSQESIDCYEKQIIQK